MKTDNVWASAVLVRVSRRGRPLVTGLRVDDLEAVSLPIATGASNHVSG